MLNDTPFELPIDSPFEDSKTASIFDIESLKRPSTSPWVQLKPELQDRSKFLKALTASEKRRESIIGADSQNGALTALAASLLAGAGTGLVTGDVKMGLGTGAGGLLGGAAAVALGHLLGARGQDGKMMLGAGGAGIGSVAGALLTRALQNMKKKKEQQET